MRRAILLAALLACGRGSPAPPPSPLRIVPTGAYRGQVAHVRVTGEGFNARAVHRLGGPSEVDDRFHLRIGGVELANAAWTTAADGQQAIEGDAPADLPVGRWDVEVEDPLGQAGTLRSAWTESDRAPPRLAVSALTPPRVEAGVAFAAEVRVENLGGEAAQLSSVVLDGASLQFGDPVLLPGEVRALPVSRSAPAGSIGWEMVATAADSVTGDPLPVASGAASFSSLVPPRLAVAAGTLPAFVDVGQQISIALTVHNEGEVAALSLLPALLVPQGVTVGGLQAQDVLPGGQVQYAATLTASSSGALDLQVAASGVDELTGASISVPAEVLGTLQVQRPAALSVSPISAPAQVSQGQTFTAQVQIANTGDAAALGVQLTALPIATGGAQVVPAPVAPFDLPGGGARSLTLTFTEDGTGPGAVQLQYSAAGTDANDAAAVTGTASSGTIAVQTPAALEVQAPVVPASIDRGQDFVVTAGVRNTGQAAAVALSGAIAFATAGGAHAWCGAAQLPASIPGGASAKVNFTCTEDGTGEGSLAATLSTLGADANSGAAISATSAASAAIAVQTAAALELVSFPVPAAVSRGQAFAVSLTVRNSGTATARGVVPDVLSVVATGGAAVSIASKPAPVDLPGGQSATFTWSLVEAGIAAGTLQFATTLRALDGNSGAPVEVSATSAEVLVQTPAHLTVAAIHAPAAVSRGQTFTVEVTVEDDGGASALGVAPQLTATGVAVVSAPAPLAIAAAASATFSFTLTEAGTGPGTLLLDLSAAGTDANSGLAVTAAHSQAAVVVQTPAALAIDSIALPQRISRGMAVPLSVVIRNSGGAAARGVMLTTVPLTSGGAAWTAGVAPAAFDLAGGASATVSIAGAESGTSDGSLAFSITASASDANSGAAIGGSAQSAPVVVEQPASLRAALSMPAAVNQGQGFVVTLQVSNTGEATAAQVTPQPPVVTSATGVVLSITGAPDPLDIAGGSSATFAWTANSLGSAIGTATVSIAADGADANSGAALTTSGSAVVEVDPPSALTVTSFTVPEAVSRGQVFTATLVVHNGGGSSALNVTPSLVAAAISGGAAASVSGTNPPVSLAPGASATFSWQVAENGTSAGALRLDASASGTDSNNGATVSTAASSAVQVEEPARLSVVSFSAPAAVDRGQAFTATALVRNLGGATAHAVTPGLVATGTGGPAATVGPAPAPAEIAGGATASFSFAVAENGTAPGALALALSVSGSDLNSGAALSASANATVTVQSPPKLAISGFTLPATISDGQVFTAALTVSNTGQATARGVSVPAPSVRATGAAAATTSSAPGAVDLAGGQSATFSFTYTETGKGTGTLQLSADVSGTDANDGSALSVSDLSNLANVQLPAALQAVVTAPASVDRGQTFDVRVVVTNTGGATANGVLASVPQVAATGGALASTASTAAPVDLPGGQSATFTFSFTENGTATGSLVFSSTATATDANSGAALSSARASSGATAVQTAGQLAVTSFTAPASIDRGQAFTVTLTVTNTGGALVKQVSATPAIAITGGAHATTSSTAAPVDLDPGASATFTWSYGEDGTDAGTLSISAHTTGTEGNTWTALSVDSVPLDVAVQVPAALSAAWNVPASAGVGTSFTASLTVTNTGGAGAIGVQPTATLTGPASIAAGPSPASATIAGGASATFTWTVSADAVGNAQLAATVAGSDANTSASLAAAATSSAVALGEATTIATDPFCAAAGGTCTDTTTFAYLFSYQGQIYLGPNKTGTGAVRMGPDGSSPTQVNWQLEVNLGAARNGAYLTGVLCHTIGFPGCAQNTTDCGPDNESGHGLFLSGFTGTTEWYALTGASSIGGARYIYMTNPGMPLAAGGYDDLAFVQVQAGQQGATRMATAGHFFDGKLYFGLLDSGTTSPGASAPVLNVLTHMPSLPGYTAALGTDLVNLQAVAMPAIGAAGSPANTGTSWLMIDAITDFAGVLYLGNNGGLVRSTSANPGPCTGSCAEWVNATPSDAAWGDKTSVTIAKAENVLGTLEPAQRAIPGIVGFGGRLFAARNTTAGPQLWSCAPAGGANAQQCDPADWSLVAGTSELTQLGDPGNSAVTLLAASGAHLYLGFNNAAGIQIWRTTNPAAATLADFTGRADCVAGASGCTPVGGAGLGNGSIRIFDGKVLTLGGQDWLYVSAGDGSTAPKVSRIVP